jgi:hypothetical protein
MAQNYTKIVKINKFITEYFGYSVEMLYLCSRFYELRA